MWTLLAFVSAVCLGGYDISKKIALRQNAVVDVLTISIWVSAFILMVPLVLSRWLPDTMGGTPFYVPEMDIEGHLFTLLKSSIVLSSWIFAYVSLKHLPLSVVSPMQATRPMWTLIGALVLFDERLNGWQWVGVMLAIGSIFAFSFKGYRRNQRTERNANQENKPYYICLALAIVIGACSGLYDKYMMRRYDHNAVQVYYMLYQALMMAVVWVIMRRKELKAHRLPAVQWTPAIVLISIFLVISEGGAIIGFGYGLVWLKEGDVWPKLACMAGVLAGLVCLAIGS